MDQENSNEALTAKVVDLVTVVLLEKKELELRLDPTEVTTTKKKTSPDPTYQPIETPKQKDLRNRVCFSIFSHFIFFFFSVSSIDHFLSPHSLHLPI